MIGDIREKRRPAGAIGRDAARRRSASALRRPLGPHGNWGQSVFQVKDTGIDRHQRINEQIRISPVRVISAEGELLGIMNTDEALARAREADQDLVEVAPNERPPVCRIMDFGKFKYQQKKRHGRGHTHQSKIKEIRVRPKTGQHDIAFKLNQARGFLQHKDKVIVSVIFRGRELAHLEEGRKVIDQIIGELEEVSKIESPPSHQGKRIVAILAPK
jgi:translation initiation factor IF-3